MKNKKISVEAVSLFFILSASQFSYFLNYGAYLALLVGIFLFILSTTNNQGFMWKSKNILYGPFIAMAFLSFLLLIFGEKGEFDQRKIFESNIFQIISVILTYKLLDSQNERQITYIFLSIIIVEILILFGQFSYISIGIGFNRVVESELPIEVISGSHGNPNNSALQLGLMAMAVSSFFILRNENSKALGVLLIILPGILLTLSRTMLFLWILNVIFIYLADLIKRFSFINLIKFSVIKTLIILMILIFYQYATSINLDIYVRIIERLDSFNSLDGDSSIDFRIISHLRLIDNIFSLNYGSFSDLNYYDYFKIDDNWLLKVNPHSYIVEYSFLFGYLGFFVIAALFIKLTYLLLCRSYIPVPLKILSVFSIYFAQAVPSSLLTQYYFFIPFIFLYKIKKN
jgi:hypothetical protein